MNIYIRNTINFIRIFARKSKEDSLPAYAAQTTFFTLLSFFPFVMLLLVFVNKLAFVKSNIAAYLLNVVPEGLQEYVIYIIDDVLYSEGYSFTIVSALVSLWSAGKGIQALTYGLDRIYRVDNDKNYFISRIMSAVYTILFMFMCVAVMILHMFGAQIARQIIKSNPLLENETILLFSFKSLFSCFIIFVLLLLVYYKLPGRKGKIKNEVFGAFVSSAAIMLLTKGFTVYMQYITKRSYMYGSITSIILLMIWLYIVMQIVLYGAQLSHLLNNNNYKTYDYE